MPVTVYLILATVFDIFEMVHKGPLQFIGSLGHYFTPALESYISFGGNFFRIATERLLRGLRLACSVLC